MPTQVFQGNLVIGYWTVLNANFVPMTGKTVPTHVTLVMHRRSGSVMVLAGESISWAEIGTSGHYFFTFTPGNTGLYALELQEIDPLSLLRNSEGLFSWEVMAAGSVFAPTYADAFCAESDVERYLLQPIDSISKPSDAHVAAWANGRADVLETVCAGLGLSVTPSTVVAGSRIQGLLREANAIGAALDARVAQTFSSGRDLTPNILSLIAAWEAYVGTDKNGKKVDGYIGMEIQQNTLSLSTNHTLSGDTIARDNSNPPQDVGSQIRMSDVY